MATLKAVVLKHHKRDDGTYNVKIRVTHRRQSVYIPTTLYVTSAQLTRRMEIKDNYLASETQILLSRYRETIVKLRGQLYRYTAKELADYLHRDYQQGGHFTLDIIAYITRVAGEITGRTAEVYRSLAFNINDLYGSIDISEINVRFLRQYQADMTARGIQGHMYLRTLRAVFNRARSEFNDEDRGDIRIPHYPFRTFRIPTTGAAPRALDVADIITIRDSKPHTRRGQLARDVFMISFYLCGMNTADIYEAAAATGGRIHYNRKKTRTRRTDGAQATIRVEDELTHYIKVYGHQRRLFRFSDMYASLATFHSAIKHGMKTLRKCDGIPAQLTIYHARHSWASIARNVCGISKDDIALALNHGKRTVTDVYIKPDFSRVDAANRAVLDIIA
jgi:integrase